MSSAIKSCFKDQPLNFMCTLCVGSYLLPKRVRITQMSLLCLILDPDEVYCKEMRKSFRNKGLNDNK
jgi:hypothetical protein